MRDLYVGEHLTLPSHGSGERLRWNQAIVKICRHVNDLIDSSPREPTQGIGEPEAPAGNMAS
ncbi:MAG: type II toxin-antitoxin system YoeB family toxin [Boseongicola sp. SB0667_bin_21]|nr:type II toxin-antitoxin system YoeB family toxin [Boseongicola sp. SB0667_bin_21]